MSNERRVLIHSDKKALAGTVAARFITKLIDVVEQQGEAHLCLTGGTMGLAVLEAIASSPARDAIDWTRVHFWWSDERWVPRGDPERNDRQARDALLGHLDLDETKVHPFPAPGDVADAEGAALAYAEELAAFARDGALAPSFDIMFLGVGPDGHVASLFPGRPGIHERSRSVIAVADSPKPPPGRLSLTLPVINAAQRVFLVLAGADKASVLGLALAGASTEEVPVAGVEGRRRTVFFVDREAAAEVPENLIAPVNYWTAADGNF